MYLFMGAGRQAGGLGAGVSKGWLLPTPPGFALPTWAFLKCPSVLSAVSSVFFLLVFLSCTFASSLGGVSEQDRILFLPQAQNCFSIACTSGHLLS